jgi:hypothetical protein
VSPAASDAEWSAWIARLDARLARGFEELDRRLDASDGSLEFAPGADGWTIHQVAEHVALANRFLLILVAKLAERSAARAAPDPQPLPHVEHIERLATHAFRWESPAHMLPAHVRPAAELRAELARQAARCRALLHALPAGHGTQHRIRMSVVGDDARLDLYEYLHVIALHVERHVRQIERNAEAWRAQQS